MADLIDAIASWPSLLLVLVIFGLAPGAVLRLLVHLYPKDDLRRRELVAELYTIRRIERPMWVCEQFETAVFEGLVHRIRARRSRGTESVTNQKKSQREQKRRQDEMITVEELLRRQLGGEMGGVMDAVEPGRHRLVD